MSAAYLTVLGFSISAIGVCQVAILIPPTTMMCQGTVAESNIIVSVKGGEFPSIVIRESITCREEMEAESLRQVPKGLTFFGP